MSELLAAIRRAESCSVPDVSLRYVPDQRTGTAELTCETGSVHLGADEVSALHDALRAHMPDRMKPLPA
ncbi:hypothetical protein [Lentzea fradiae]|uniref:hypothetical protein n=1 Tax=Lentzea fradiae TaxID=200378 RepID=UPI00115FD4AF|nr:hypothetical protein [Lentzea fradiae]